MSDSPNLPHPPLSIIEARILGCLCEKEVTTPDYYPLTLNALVNACNQKSNRHPILELGDDAVDAALETLRFKKLVSRVSQAEARVAKFKHTLELVYPITPEQQAILTELLLRGPQTVGELRGRCERLGYKTSLERMHEAILELTRGEFPLLRELPRQAGRKDVRFAHLLSGEPDLESTSAAEGHSNAPLKVDVAITLPPEAEARIAALEATVAEQSAAIDSLRAELAAFRAQFE